MLFAREWAMPTADTFDCKPIGEFVRKYLTGISVDPFARNKRWATHTNDLNPATEAEHHMEARDFLEMLADHGVKADCLIIDPPYSPRQITECYALVGRSATMQDTQSSFYTRIRASAKRLCKRGTIVLSFGWNSTGMGAGFVQREILLVAHGGAHNDTICLAEEMTQEQVELFS
jgi:hypothetical protein